MFCVGSYSVVLVMKLYLWGFVTEFHIQYELVIEALFELHITEVCSQF